MNTSLCAADRNTHVKVVAVSMMAAIAVVVVALNVRIDGSNVAAARAHINGPVAVKAGNPMTVTANDAVQVR